MNGTVEWLARDHPDHDEIHGAWTVQYGSDPYSWGSVTFFRINPTAMWTYAGKPKEFPAS